MKKSKYNMHIKHQNFWKNEILTTFCSLNYLFWWPWEISKIFMLKLDILDCMLSHCHIFQKNELWKMKAIKVIKHIFFLQVSVFIKRLWQVKRCTCILLLSFLSCWMYHYYYFLFWNATIVAATLYLPGSFPFQTRNMTLT